jgi:hypothetical protein
MIPGHELTHDIVNGQYHDFSVTRRGFCAESADGRHQIMFMFCWRPGDAPHPQSLQIRYVGPQSFHTADNECLECTDENKSCIINRVVLSTAVRPLHDFLHHPQDCLECTDENKSCIINELYYQRLCGPCMISCITR